MARQYIAVGHRVPHMCRDLEEDYAWVLPLRR
jgi:hypothetical protein